MSDRFVCSDASIARAEPVIATASQVKAWLLIEVPGAWGVDAIAESELGPHVPAGWARDLKRRGIRPVCIRRGVDERADSHRDSATMFFVVPQRPGATVSSQCWKRTATVLAAVPYLTDGLDPAAAATAGPGDGWEPYDERLVLVCTNGRHDQCCATRGRPLVRHLRTTRYADQLWECSHVGGDRFAANMVILPDSLYYGRCDGRQAEHVLAEHDAGRVVLDGFRGRSTLRMPEQAAEEAVRRHFGTTGLDAVRLVARPTPEEFRLDVDDTGAVLVTMAITTVHVDEPVTCRGTPHQDVPRYDIVSIEPLDR